MQAAGEIARPRSLGDRLRRLEARHWLAILNSLILLVAQYFYSILESYDVLLLAITASILTEIALSLAVRSKFPPSILNAYISGVSTTLLAKVASGALWPIAAVAILSIASKYVLTWRGRHIWNPTNFGIAVMLLCAPNSMTILSHEFGNSPIANAIIWCVGLIVVARARFLHITFAYLPAFVAFAALRAGLHGGELRAELAPLTGPMYQLFIFFMVTDPPTAVTGKKHQVIVAILVAAMESLLRMGNDAGLPLFGVFSAAPAIFGLAIVGPIAKLIDLERSARTVVAPRIA